jgi:CRISPR/Cas system CSM-associated protein Csm3 (group 7 of RAMP superfamily)
MTQELPRADHRLIIKHIIVRGTLVLDTPTCLGSGDAEGLTDLILLRDSISPKALLTGSSLAGALRNYLHEREQGYGNPEVRKGLATKLFGHLFRYEEDETNKSITDEESQSPLIIDDAISSNVPIVELRDGVKIKGATGTADEGAKYDLELLTEGTQFPLCLELLIEKDEAELKKALALALKGLESGEIGIGMRKRRGFGRCHVEKWEVWEFDLKKHKGLIDWLKFDRSFKKPSKPTRSDTSIAAALGGIPLKQEKDRRDRLFIHATFKLASPLLIRSGQDLTQKSTTSKDSNKRIPDVVHLRSQRKGKFEPVASGTSLAGVLRHRAERIVNTLGKDLQIVSNIFGFVEEQGKQASRLTVHESAIDSTDEIVQNRIAIDRFTGGALHGALFSEQPIFGIEKKDNSSKNKKGKGKPKKSDVLGHLKLELELQNTKNKEHEIGLLLLLLKDLWTGDLHVGGTSSIGRGRLQGMEATIVCQQSDEPEQKWVITQNDAKLKISEQDRNKNKLEDFVQKFVEK